MKMLACDSHASWGYHLTLLTLPCTAFAAGAAALVSLGGLATDSLSLGLACLSLLLGSAMNYLLIWHRI